MECDIEVYRNLLDSIYYNNYSYHYIKHLVPSVLIISCNRRQKSFIYGLPELLSKNIYTKRCNAATIISEDTFKEIGQGKLEVKPATVKLRTYTGELVKY